MSPDDEPKLSPALQASLDRLQASCRETNVASFRLSIEVAETVEHLRRLVETMQEIEDRAVFEPPDVMELDLHDAAWNPDQP